VTGGASGIGKATAHRLAEEGAAVVLSDIQDAEGELVAAHVREKGHQATFLHHDVTVEDDWRRVVEQTLEGHGQLDILFNNAGIGGEGSIADATLESYERTVAVTQTSVFLGMRTAAHALEASEHGVVISMCSIFGSNGGFGSGPGYHAAKGAVRLMTKNAAVYWASAGVRVNSIHPGFIDTPLLEEHAKLFLSEMLWSHSPRPARTA